MEHMIWYLLLPHLLHRLCVNTETDTPVFFCAVSAPVAAGVITDMDKPDKNATGTSNAIPVSDIIDFAQSVTPAKKVWYHL